MFYVYIIESQKDSGWYIGCTEDINKRLIAHNSGKNLSTKNRKPFKLIYCEIYLNKLDAFGREKFLKSGSGNRFIKKQIKYYLSESLPVNHKDPTASTSA